MQSENYKDFKEFSDTTTSIHFPQDYQAIEYLKSNDIIPKDSIFVNMFNKDNESNKKADSRVKR